MKKPQMAADAAENHGRTSEKSRRPKSEVRKRTEIRKPKGEREEPRNTRKRGSAWITTDGRRRVRVPCLHDGNAGGIEIQPGTGCARGKMVGSSKLSDFIVT